VERVGLDLVLQLLALLHEVLTCAECIYFIVFHIVIMNFSSALVKVSSEPGIVRAPSAQPVRRKRQVPVDADSDLEGGDSMESPATLTSANHNKYCHFCQHVKVKDIRVLCTAGRRSHLDSQVRASSMLACQNPECCRRFCEHCLVTHLNEDVDPMSSCAWSLLDGKVKPRDILFKLQISPC
jgi:hypothetical protein